MKLLAKKKPMIPVFLAISVIAALLFINAIEYAVPAKVNIFPKERDFTIDVKIKVISKIIFSKNPLLSKLSLTKKGDNFPVTCNMTYKITKFPRRTIKVIKKEITVTDYTEKKIIMPLGKVKRGLYFLSAEAECINASDKDRDYFLVLKKRRKSV